MIINLDIHLTKFPMMLPLAKKPFTCQNFRTYLSMSWLAQEDRIPAVYITFSGERRQEVLKKHYFRAILLIIACYFLSGCATLQGLVQVKPLRQKIMDELNEIQKTADRDQTITMLQMAFPSNNPSDPEIIKNRLNFIGLQEKKYNALIQGATKILIHDVEKQGEWAGAWNIGLSIGSIGAGIAIAALAAANASANAVWIAAIGAFSAGVAIFQGVLAREGINRDVLEKYRNNLIDGVKAASEKINFMELRAKAGEPNEKWFKLLSDLGKNMRSLELAVLLTSREVRVEQKPNQTTTVPTGTTSP